MRKPRKKSPLFSDLKYQIEDLSVGQVLFFKRNNRMRWGKIDSLQKSWVDADGMILIPCTGEHAKHYFIRLDEIEGDESQQ